MAKHNSARIGGSMIHIQTDWRGTCSTQRFPCGGLRAVPSTRECGRPLALKDLPQDGKVR